MSSAVNCILYNFPDCLDEDVINVIAGIDKKYNNGVSKAINNGVDITPEIDYPDEGKEPITNFDRVDIRRITLTK